MGKILIAVPSKNRVEILKKDTLRWLSQTPFDYKIFVEPQDEAGYRTITNELVVYPENDRGIGYAKNQIYQYAKANGYDYIFKIDDDLHGFCQRGGNQKEIAHLNFIELVNDCLELLDNKPEVKGIGFPYRNELYEVKKWVGINLRFQTCFITRIDWWHSDPQVSRFDDFINYIYIRSRNGITLRYGKMGMDCEEVGLGKGGCVNVDNSKQALAMIDYIRKNLYPAIKVKKSDKPWQYEPELTGKFFGAKKL